jgi:alkylated DNA repair dioxygenase AlkB
MSKSMSARRNAPAQAELFAPPAPRGPPGFGDWPDAISPGEETDLARRLGELPFAPYDFHGFAGNRRVVSFGWRYDHGAGAVLAAPPAPDWLADVRERVAALCEVPAEAFAQVLINEYQPGAAIGWHRDRPHFALVAGVSLLAPCTLRFRRAVGERWERLAAPLAPRSAYRLSGPARHEWQHSIRPMDALRYSITFRTLAPRPPAKRPPAPR